MVKIDAYIPTKVIFGAGRLEELATAKLPGQKALICVTEDGLMKKLGIQDKVIELLEKNHVQAVVYDKITPNPTRKGVMEAAALAKKENCDFTLGLGGGSSVDTAKAVAILMRNPGDIWDYASTGSGGRKEIQGAAPIVTVSTTCGTGTETDPYAVITNEETGEKLDFAIDVIFPTISFIDPSLMLTLPHMLTLYQGFDALFHVSECYISNEHRNRLLDVYSKEAVTVINQWLPEVSRDGKNLEARSWMAYAADILGGYTQSIVNTTSHHIIAQTMGGLFPKVAHGLSLIFIAEAYYKKVKEMRPELLDELGGFMGIPRDPDDPGAGFVKALNRLMDETGVRHLAMSEYGITPDDFAKIADITVDSTKIDWEKYTITKENIIDILKESYR